MKASRLSKRRKMKFSLVASLFILLTIPLAVYALIQGDSFDTGSDASEGEVVNMCSMNFLYVNPETLQVGSVTQVGLTGYVIDEGESIISVSITDSSGNSLFQKEYPDGVTQIAEAFTYSANAQGDTRMLGVMETSLTSHPCVLADARGSVLSVLAANSAPTFTSDPYVSATPSSVISLEDTYNYQLTATDIDGDDIRYAYSFTPNADWLQMSVVEDGSEGSLVLDFSGTPEDYASFLANVFIHDGYNTHLSSQSWVISVEPTENDIPIVTLTEPAGRIEITAGEILPISWTATDRNQIVNYRLYIATNPGNANTWIAIDENLSYQVGQYLLDTSNLTPGIYKVIVQAVDNQEPAAIGTGISNEIAVSSPLPTDPGDPGDPGDPEPDDGPVLVEPQINNVQPANKSTVTNERVTISATLITADNTEVNLDSIVFKLDDKELTDRLDVAEITDSEVKVIFRPTEDLEQGEHKVYVEFETSDGKKATRDWTFTLDSDDSNDDTFNFFGFEISKRTAYIIGAGLVVLLLALMIPWLLYIAWRDDDEDLYDVYPTSPPVTTTTSSTTTTTASKAATSDTGTAVYTPVLYKDESVVKKSSSATVVGSEDIPVVKSNLSINSTNDTERKLEHVVIPERTIMEKSAAPTSSSSVKYGVTETSTPPSGGTQVFQTKASDTKPTSTPINTESKDVSFAMSGPTGAAKTPAASDMTSANQARSVTSAVTSAVTSTSTPAPSPSEPSQINTTVDKPTTSAVSTSNSEKDSVPAAKPPRPGIEYPPKAAFADVVKPEDDDSRDSGELAKLAEQLKKESEERKSFYSDKPAAVPADSTSSPKSVVPTSVSSAVTPSKPVAPTPPTSNVTGTTTQSATPLTQQTSPTSYVTKQAPASDSQSTSPSPNVKPSTQPVTDETAAPKADAPPTFTPKLYPKPVSKVEAPKPQPVTPEVASTPPAPTSSPAASPTMPVSPSPSPAPVAPPAPSAPATSSPAPVNANATPSTMPAPAPTAQPAPVSVTAPPPVAVSPDSTTPPNPTTPPARF